MNDEKGRPMTYWGGKVSSEKPQRVARPAMSQGTINEWGLAFAALELYADQLELELAQAKHDLKRALANHAADLSVPSAKPAIPKGYHLVCDECGSIPGDVCLAPSRCPTENRKA